MVLKYLKYIVLTIVVLKHEIYKKNSYGPEIIGFLGNNC